MPTYWLVVGLYSLWLWAEGRIGLTTGLWSLSALHYWFRIPDSFNWYVPALLAFYLLAPAYKRLFARCSHKELLTALVFPVSYGLYRLSIVLDIIHIADFLFRLPAFALGFLAGWYLEREQPLTRRHLLAWGGLALAGAVTGVMRLKGMLYISTCYFIAAELMPLCLLGGKAVSLLPGNLLRRGLACLGECSLEIYLLNVIATREHGLLAAVLPRGPGGLGCYALIWGGNLVLGILLHKGLEALRKQT